MERILRKSAPTPDGCRVWTGRLLNSGYGQIMVKQAGYKAAAFSAHRAAYELTKGRVPDGLVLDHLCRNPACVNPDHLEPVTQRENILRSPTAQGSVNARKTLCPHGHPYSPENTYTYTRPNTVMRVCKTCRSKYSRAYRARRAAAQREAVQS